MVYCFSTDNESRIQAEVSCNKAVMTSNKTIREGFKKKIMEFSILELYPPTPLMDNFFWQG